MKTLPVRSTIKAAYLFAFEHLGAIIGLIWLPMILLTVIGFFVLQRYYNAFADALASGNYAAMGPEVLGLLCYMVAALLLSTMMAVPVAQLALGQRKSGSLVHFAFGGMEWRLFRALAGLVGFLLLPLMVVGLVAGGLEAAGGGPLGGEKAALAVQLLVALFYLACIFFGVRFGALLPALAVSEDKALLPRAWTLSAGNFWRLLVVMLAAVGPVVLASGILDVALQGHDTIMPTLTSSTAMAAAEFHAMAQNMPLTSGVSFLIAPLLIGLAIGASASAFQHLHAPAKAE